MWVKFESNNSVTVSKLRKHLKFTGVKTVVVAGIRSTIANIRDDHGMKWASDTAKEYSSSALLTDLVDSYEVVPCGMLVLTVKMKASHQSRCKSCRAIKGNGKRDIAVVPSKRRKAAEKAETVVDVLGLQDFSVNGMLSILKQREHELMELTERYSDTIKALDSLGAMESEFARLKDEEDKHKQALRYFLEKEKSNLIE